MIALAYHIASLNESCKKWAAFRQEAAMREFLSSPGMLQP
jgi:hypothetical protein